MVHAIWQQAGSSWRGRAGWSRHRIDKQCAKTQYQTLARSQTRGRSQLRVLTTHRRLRQDASVHFRAAKHMKMPCGAQQR